MSEGSTETPKARYETSPPEAVALAAEVWAKLKDRNDDFSEAFLNELGAFICTNCGSHGSDGWCCYESRWE